MLYIYYVGGGGDRLSAHFSTCFCLFSKWFKNAPLIHSAHSCPFIQKCCIILYHLFVPNSGGEVAVVRVCVWSPHSNVIHDTRTHN